MWLRNHLSQISMGSPAAGTRLYASDSPDRPAGKPANLNVPEDYLRMKEWIDRVQTAAQKARDEYTQDQAARARRQASHPDFYQEHSITCVEAEETAADECTEDESA